MKIILLFPFFLVYFSLYERNKLLYNRSIVITGGGNVNCLKCGREIDEGQVFCGDCLLDMQRYPVKPGTPVQLPSRADCAAPKKAHFRRRSKTSLEEQLRSLKVLVRVLTVLLALCVLLLAAAAIPAFRYINEDHILPGQNYSAVTPSAPSGG